jgi:hypothetical protein
MGLADFEVYVQERIRAWDETVDLSSGSPIDSQVIQPIIRRLGTDPFTMDAAAFIYDRLAQEHPEIAVGVGDATADLLIKQALMLWDPIIREIKRVSAMLSFKDPYILNTTEAEALGANLFTERGKGKYSKGVVRIYFSQPQNFSLTQSNYSSPSSSGLRYFPTQIQSIRREEMMLNTEGELYYFDANYIAEKAGESYNIEPGSISTVANVTAAIRVTNKNRFRDGLDEDDAVTFVGKIARELTERSLVTLRGIVAKVTKNLPEITTVQVVGYGDPEMQRDVISGGGLGPIQSYGSGGQAAPDGHFKLSSYRLRDAGADFFASIGPVGDVRDWIMTVVDGFVTVPMVRDIAVTKVIDAITVELAEQVIDNTKSSIVWMLRKWELTLSGIPGGILYPDGTNGTVTVPSNQIHIGGCTDTFTRGTAFETSTLVIDVASDDNPLLSGLQANPTTAGALKLTDYVLGTNYTVNDAVYTALNNAAFYQHTIEVLQGNNEGPYRVLGVTQAIGFSPIVYVEPAPPSIAGTDTARWRLIDTLEIDLVEPKETRIAATDGQTYQNVFTFTTVGGATDFNAAGVSVGDVLRIENGREVGDFIVEQLVLPSYTSLQVDRPFKYTTPNVRYRIFRSNISGGVKRPLVRINSIDLLDTSGQPVGVSIPFSDPVDIVASAFSNAGRGTRIEVHDALIGLVSLPGPFNFGAFPGPALVLEWENEYGTSILMSVPLGGSVGVAASSVVVAINAVSSGLGYGSIAQVAVDGVSEHVAIRPPGANARVGASSSLLIVQALFGTGISSVPYPTAGSVRVSGYDWTALNPSFSNNYDVLQLVDGVQSGFYSFPETKDNDTERVDVDALFEPEVNRVVRVGSRSFGTVRLYFLQPTSFEVDQATVFTAINEDGIELTYKPDPELWFQMIPSLPNESQPKDGAVPSFNAFASSSQDFIKAGVRAGDELVITYKVFSGTVALADPVVGLAGLNLAISLNDSPDRVITFLGDAGGILGEVTRDGITNQINAWIGQQICSMVENPSGSGNYYLTFDATMRVVVRSFSSANTILGFSTFVDTWNDADNKGHYSILSVVSTTSLLVDSSSMAVETDVQFQINRLAAQRISSTAMNANTAPASLYYFDIELVSHGAGDLYNLKDGQVLLSSGYRSDGFYLSTNDPNTSFSTMEDVVLHLSRSILEVGADDSPANATQISGQQLSISYEYSASVASNQALQSSDSERVVCQSPLARSLVPHFVRFDLTYKGGSKETVVRPLIESYIKLVNPADAIESSDLQKIVSGKGASYISNPVDLVAVVHDLDRRVYLHRSQDRLTTGRLAAFVPDVIKLTRSTT